MGDRNHTTIRRVINEEVRPIVRQETQGLYADLAEIKETLKTHGDTLGTHALQLQSLRSELSHLRAVARSQAQAVTRIDVLLDDLNERLLAARELRWE